MTLTYPHTCIGGKERVSEDNQAILHALSQLEVRLIRLEAGLNRILYTLSIEHPEAFTRAGKEAAEPRPAVLASGKAD